MLLFVLQLSLQEELASIDSGLNHMSVSSAEQHLGHSCFVSVIIYLDVGIFSPSISSVSSSPRAYEINLLQLQHICDKLKSITITIIREPRDYRPRKQTQNS